ncbi:hypothetical protein HELRODRAFT_194517 [Helobdella robusta]|uniref:Peptidase M12B domain-containing protein n=1 Tax=Helobdella robusta TaxID=6412 RepID=T1FW54_HELRO|nr:hypothetical protein HELRODRAFT_194517 [Helobdella robusta]ESN91185.1 hypothetical protein HELRODRAFT_194517 [Helobdella robusta]
MNFGKISMLCFGLLVLCVLADGRSYNDEHEDEMMAIDKRAASEMVIDVFVVSDYSIFKTWMGYYKNDKAKVLANIKYYFANIVNAISKRYESIRTSKYRYSARMVSIYIATTPEESPFTETPKVKNSENKVDTIEGLKAFESWIKEKSLQGKLPKFSVATAFTKYDSVNAPGYAWVGTVCEINANAMVVDTGGYSTADLASHEIGHNLGANHDGERGKEGNNCNGNDQFLMTAIQQAQQMPLNHQKFSPCSVKYFDDKVDALKKINKNCLKPKEKTTAEDFSSQLSVLPGQKFDIDEQCRYIYGPESYYCRRASSPENTICEEVYCFDSKQKRCLGGNRYSAYDGTSCANKKWCMDKKCVYDAKAPVLKETCPFGDSVEPIEYSGRLTKCSDLKQQRRVCTENEFMAKYCCGTCEQVAKEGPQECQEGYLDYYNNCDEMTRGNLQLCEQSYYLENCCKTCTPYVKELNKCRKGTGLDKSSCTSKVKCNGRSCAYSGPGATDSRDKSPTKQPQTPPSSKCTKDVHEKWCRDNMSDETKKKLYCKSPGYAGSCCKTCQPYLG